MGPRQHAVPSADGASRPRWSEVLRALREARGSTVEGWGARLGVSGRTVLRWERGARTPDPGAEALLLAYCREAGLFRSYDRGPLAGLSLTAELVQDLLAGARWRVGRAPATASPASNPSAVAQADGMPQDAPRPPPSNLPAQLTSFVGRMREIADVRRVQAGTRLLTLTGTGGVGKTRLALALADELLWAYPHGVWSVDLAPLADSALLPQAVASALEVRATGQQPVTEALVAALRAQHLLLLLDNCEHLLPACAALVEVLLRACPHLEVITTSREPLGIGGETIYRVPSMAVPASTFQVPGPDSAAVEPGTWKLELEQADSVRLFVERARQYRPEFDLTARNAAAVVEVCRRLDDMPLALELAAARVTILSPEQIAARLDQRFQLLTGGGRTVLPRQQTLRATLEWSHDLLAERERALLWRLSVFAGGFPLEAAEAVCAGGGDGHRTTIDTADVLNLLGRLVDKSLVVADDQVRLVRYRMLETVREYAAERLRGDGEARATRARHAAWCLALTEAASPHLQGPRQGAWLERLTVEHDNIRAALGWCLTDEGDAALGLRLAGRLWWVWFVRGHYSEGRQWLGALLARDCTAPPEVRARALEGAGVLAKDQGDHDEAERLIEQSLALRRRLGDKDTVAGTLTNLGTVVSARGDYDRARALYGEALVLRRASGDRKGVTMALVNLGIVAWRQGELDQAVALTEEGVAVLREVGDTRNVAAGLHNLGSIHRDQGALERAAARYRESLALSGEVQDRLLAARSVEGLGVVAALRGEAEQGARLCGAAAALRAAIGVPLQSAGRAVVERAAAAARAALGDAEFTAAWAAGEALSFEEAVACALADTEPA
jgi:non-specific serine/threonine protein kinase